MVHKGLRHCRLGNNTCICCSKLITSSVVGARGECAPFVLAPRSLKRKKRLRPHLCSGSTATGAGLRIRGGEEILRSLGMRLLQCLELLRCQNQTWRSSRGCSGSAQRGSTILSQRSEGIHNIFGLLHVLDLYIDLHGWPQNKPHPPAKP